MKSFLIYLIYDVFGILFVKNKKLFLYKKTIVYLHFKNN